MEVRYPKNEDEWLSFRTQDVTSTEVSALFGLSPYITTFELFHHKKDKTIVKRDSERMRWGRALQDAIAAEIAKDMGRTCRRMNEYVRISELRMGSSFDFELEYLEYEHENNIGGGGELLEIKNVDQFVFKNQWSDIESPPHIEIQVQHQLAVTGFKTAYIGVLVGGNQAKIYKRERDESMISAICERVADFWKLVEANTEPKIDYKRDHEFISKMYKYAEPGKIMQGTLEIGRMAERYRDLGKTITGMQSERDMIKAAMLREIKDAERVMGDYYTISAGVVGPAEVKYTREGYRSFRVFWKKEK